MIPETLQTEHLTLRPFSSEDGSAVYAYWKSDPGWEKFNESVPGFTESDASAFVAEMSHRDRGVQPNWAIVHDDGVVGVVSLNFDTGRKSASVGYGIHSRLRGRSLCVEAVEMVMACAFLEHPELDLINAFTDSRNSASIRVLKKLGFSECSNERESGSTFCITRSDWDRR